MPNLDFLTLYFVIFLNSLTVAIVWGAFAYRYRTNAAPRYWLVGCVLVVIGGVVLAIQGNEGSLIPAIAGNTIIIFGFLQYWIGLRRFEGRGGGQAVAAVMSLVALSIMVAFHDNDRARSIVYAGGQATVMLISAVHLFRMRPFGIGNCVAGTAFAIALLGQVTVVAGNTAVLSGVLPFASFYTMASYALLCTIFTACVWNLGFAIMLVEKLQGELGRLSETDELTGLPNRRALKRRLAVEHQCAVRTGDPYSAMVVDLNEFKRLNDTYGHAAGDRALVDVATILNHSLRRSDVAARTGGDEFCVILPSTSREEAHAIADAIVERFRIHVLRVDGKDIRMSASIGVAQWTPENQTNPEAVIAEADKQLYKEKAKTRALTNEPRRRFQLVASGAPGISR